MEQPLIDFDQLVRKRIKELGGNVNALEREHGFPTGYIRGVIRDDEKKSVPTLPKAQKICRALGMCLSISDARQPTATGLAEAARAFLHIDGDRSALEQGYLPIPYHHADRAHVGATPLALASAWLKGQGIDIEQLYAVAAPSAEMAPQLAEGDTLLIEASKRPGAEPALFACTVEGRLRVGFVVEPTKDHVTLWFTDQRTPAIVQFPRAGTRIFIIGQVVARFGTLA